MDASLGDAALPGLANIFASEECLDGLLSAPERLHDGCDAADGPVAHVPPELIPGGRAFIGNVLDRVGERVEHVAKVKAAHGVAEAAAERVAHAGASGSASVARLLL